MPLPAPDTTAQVALTAAQVAASATLHSMINHALLVIVAALIGIVGWFGRGTLQRIESKICGKADKEKNDEEHQALFAHYHEVKIDDCRPPKCSGKAGDLMVPHQPKG
jgi:hypothetical protein